MTTGIGHAWLQLLDKLLGPAGQASNEMAQQKDLCSLKNPQLPQPASSAETPGGGPAPCIDGPGGLAATDPDRPTLAQGAGVAEVAGNTGTYPLKVDAPRVSSPAGRIVTDAADRQQGLSSSKSRNFRNRWDWLRENTGTYPIDTVGALLPPWSSASSIAPGPCKRPFPPCSMLPVSGLIPRPRALTPTRTGCGLYNSPYQTARPT